MFMMNSEVHFFKSTTPLSANYELKNTKCLYPTLTIIKRIK